MISSRGGGGGGTTPGNSRWGCAARLGLGSPNPDPSSDQKMSFSTPFFRPGLQNPYPFSDLEKLTNCDVYDYIGGNYVIM